MSIFSKPQTIILKDSTRDEDYLKQLNDFLQSVSDEETKKKIEKEIAVVKAGITGEKNIIYELQNSHMDMVVLHDLYFETNTGHTAQIDFMVICSKIIFIIECKNLIGNIEINSKGDFVRTIYYGKKFQKEGIYSPITENQRHLEVLKEKKADSQKNIIMTALSNYGFADYFKSLVVLANPKTVLNDKFAKKEVKSQVYRADQLVNVIKKINQESKNPKSSLKEMQDTGNVWLNRLSDHPDTRIDHFKMLQNTVSNEQPSEKKCPKCGKPLVKRISKRGENKGQEFWGCSGFPYCRYSELGYK